MCVPYLNKYNKNCSSIRDCKGIMLHAATRGETEEKIINDWQRTRHNPILRSSYSNGACKTKKYKGLGLKMSFALLITNYSLPAPYGIM
jgi:hypothetical protein